MKKKNKTKPLTQKWLNEDCLFAENKTLPTKVEECMYFEHVYPVDLSRKLP